MFERMKEGTIDLSAYELTPVDDIPQRQYVKQEKKKQRRRNRTKERRRKKKWKKEGIERKKRTYTVDSLETVLTKKK